MKPTHPKLTELLKSFDGKLNTSLITGHISGRHLILIGGKKDREWEGAGYEENEYQYLDEYIKSFITHTFESGRQVGIEQGRQSREEEIVKLLESRKKDTPDNIEHPNYEMFCKNCKIYDEAISDAISACVDGAICYNITQDSGAEVIWTGTTTTITKKE